MMYPLVLEMAVDGIPVTVTCRVLRFSTQAFYQWKRNPIEDRYNRRRRHSSIGHVTPVDFEMQYSSQAAEIQLAA
jgi:hypothetical protein